MYRFIPASTLIIGLVLAAPAYAKSYHVHTSSSVHISTDGNGTEQTMQRSVNNSDTGEAQTTVTTCIQDACTTKKGSGNSASARLSVTHKNGMVTKEKWNTWGERLLQTIRGNRVGSALADDSKTLNRIQTRLAKRICRQFDGDERDQCMNDAVEGEGTIRLRLRSWVERINN